MPAPRRIRKSSTRHGGHGFRIRLRPPLWSLQRERCACAARNGLVALADHSKEERTRYVYDLEHDQSTRSMKLPLEMYRADTDAAPGSWVLP